MTDERREHNNTKAAELTEIILWSFENRKLWNHLCTKIDSGMSELELGEALDCLMHDGHMALYYIILMRIGDITESGLEKPDKFLYFLKGTIHKDFWPDMEKIEAALGINVSDT